MAVASLNKMTVPIGTESSTQGLLMPKLSFRFRVTFSGFGINTTTTELTKQVVSCGRPSVTFADIELPVYNSTVKLAGKPSWADLSVVIRDDASSSVATLVAQQLQKQFDFGEQSSAKSGTNYKFEMKIEILDGGNGTIAPIVLDTWEVYGAYLQNVSYGEMSYSSNEPVQITMSIKFDNAMQTSISTTVVTAIVNEST